MFMNALAGFAGGAAPQIDDYAKFLERERAYERQYNAQMAQMHQSAGNWTESASYLQAADPKRRPVDLSGPQSRFDQDWGHHTWRQGRDKKDALIGDWVGSIQNEQVLGQLHATRELGSSAANDLNAALQDAYGVRAGVRWHDKAPGRLKADWDTSTKVWDRNQDRVNTGDMSLGVAEENTQHTLKSLGINNWNTPHTQARPDYQQFGDGVFSRDPRTGNLRLRATAPKTDSPAQALNAQANMLSSQASMERARQGGTSTKRWKLGANEVLVDGEGNVVGKGTQQGEIVKVGPGYQVYRDGKLLFENPYSSGGSASLQYKTNTPPDGGQEELTFDPSDGSTGNKRYRHEPMPDEAEARKEFAGTNKPPDKPQAQVYKPDPKTGKIAPTGQTRAELYEQQFHRFYQEKKRAWQQRSKKAYEDRNLPVPPELEELPYPGAPLAPDATSPQQDSRALYRPRYASLFERHGV